MPESLIATRPVEGRQNSRLLVYYRESDRIEHHYFYELPEILPTGACTVFNRSQVYPCRLFGQRPSGGKAELFVLSVRPNREGHFPCLLRSKGKKEVGEQWVFGERKISLAAREGDIFWMDLGLEQDQLTDFLQQNGRIPIPPYIRGGVDDQRDRRDYQTVYAREVGSVAAPTAGLHFTPELLERMETHGIHRCELTLHVGMGTFAPVKTRDIRQHSMHSEQFFIDQENLTALQRHRKNLIAVGTTSLRALESIHNSEREDFDIAPSQIKETDIFIYPGRPIESVQGLITNFHLPKSTLLMLVSAMIGREKLMQLYREAIEKKYRFYSYGDAMCIL